MTLWQRGGVAKFGFTGGGFQELVAGGHVSCKKLGLKEIYLLLSFEPLKEI